MSSKDIWISDYLATLCTVLLKRKWPLDKTLHFAFESLCHCRSSLFNKFRPLLSSALWTVSNEPDFFLCESFLTVFLEGNCVFKRWEDHTIKMVSSANRKYRQCYDSMKELWNVRGSFHIVALGWRAVPGCYCGPCLGIQTDQRAIAHLWLITMVGEKEHVSKHILDPFLLRSALLE